VVSPMRLSMVLAALVGTTIAPPAVAQQVELHVGPPIEVAAEDFEVTGELGRFESRLHAEQLEPGIVVVRVRIESATAEEPPEFTVRWSIPSVDIAAFWNTNLNNDRINYYRTGVQSRASSGAPVIALYNSADVNRITVAVSDALNKVNMRAYLREEDARFHYSITFLSERSPATTGYEAEIRIDTRSIPYYEALAGVADWWAGRPNYTPAPVPDAARWPMYSTWYSFHQNLDVEEVLAELRIAKTLGYDAVIVDDGWQTLDSQRGYRYTGDWEPERIPDMRGFVDSVHSIGMDFLLWYSVPLVGEDARNFERFDGMYLRHWESQGAWVLDPRYPEVREFIIGTYVQAMDDWELDGFKLDFIGFFAATDETVLEAGDGRDYASVNEAVDRLMTDVMERLRAENPDVLVEFRQPYVGPLMRKYGNMFRGVDAPNNAIANRAEVTNIRLLGGNTAVHSDMLEWHAEDTVESAALQLLNILFSVPQLSVRLTQLPDDHIEMIGFWTGYWRENRAVLLDGDFMPVNPGAAYPVLKAARDGKAIVGVYNDMLVTITDGPFTQVDLVNAKGTRTLAVNLESDMGPVEITVYDTMGRIVSQESRELTAGVHGFAAPASGLVRIHSVGG